MGVSSLLCLVPALLATASVQAGTLTCDVCFGYTAACDLFQSTCQSDQATGGCISVAGETSLDGTQDSVFSSQCLSSYKSDIKFPVTFSLGNGQYVRNNVTQCNNTNLCNSALPQVSPDTAPNGLQCPTCFALNFAACNSEITPCTGQETYCLNYFGFLTQGASRSPFQAQGCASASTQEIKPGHNLTVGAYTFEFYWGSSVPAKPIPTSVSIPSTATTTPPRSTTSIPHPANTTSPATKTTHPATDTTTPDKKTTHPATNTTTPDKKTTHPATDTTTPDKKTTHPATNTTTPDKKTTHPATNTTTPDKKTTHPATDTTTPDKKTTHPATDTTTPDKKTTHPATDTTTPDKKTTHPATNTTSPATKTTRATDTTTPDKKTTHPATDTTKNTTHTTVTSTTNGGSSALGKVPFALYLPGLMGLLLVKLLS